MMNRLTFAARRLPLTRQGSVTFRSAAKSRDRILDLAQELSIKSVSKTTSPELHVRQFSLWRSISIHSAYFRQEWTVILILANYLP